VGKQEVITEAYGEPKPLARDLCNVIARREKAICNSKPPLCKNCVLPEGQTKLKFKDHLVKCPHLGIFRQMPFDSRQCNIYKAKEQ
jgi:hypothetical protein